MMPLLVLLVPKPTSAFFSSSTVESLKRESSRAMEHPITLRR